MTAANAREKSPVSFLVRLDPGINLLNKPFTAATLATKIENCSIKPDPRRYIPASVMGPRNACQGGAGLDAPHTAASKPGSGFGTAH
jgi:hypothetical protein